MGFHLAAAALMLSATAASAAGPIVVHRDPGCGCCEQWAAQVRTQFDRSVRMVDDQNRSALQRARGVPASLSSCHTALIDGMVFEGHVPMADMRSEEHTSELQSLMRISYAVFCLTHKTDIFLYLQHTNT